MNVASFGKTSTLTVDGQSLQATLVCAGFDDRRFSHECAFYVATMNNSIYAFDAKNGAKGPLAHRVLAAPVPVNLAGTCPDPGTTTTQLGILSTPVANPATNTLYVVAASPNGPATYIHQLFAVDMLTLQDKHAPVTIAASVPGSAPDGQGGVVSLNQTRHVQRTGLVFANNTIYAAFGSCGPDPQPYHGWLIGYNPSTLQQTVVFNASPNGFEDGIWQSDERFGY